MRFRGAFTAILALGLTLAAPAATRGADLTGLPGLEAPPSLPTPDSKPKRAPRSKKPVRTRKTPPKRKAPRPAKFAQPSSPTPLPAAVPASSASPGKYAGARFAFETPLTWKGPVAVEAGVQYVPDKGDASCTVRFAPKGHRLYREPGELRRWLREQGSIEDSHTLDTVKIGSLYGSRARFSTHLYGGRYLFGKRRQRRYNEMIFVPTADGAFLVHYEARVDAFDRFRGGYLTMLKTMTLASSGQDSTDEYYSKRLSMIRPLIEEVVEKDVSQHGGMNQWYGNPYRAVVQFGVPVAAKHGGNSLGGGKVFIAGGLLGVNETLSLGGSLTKTGYSGASSLAIDLLVRMALLQQKPITPFISFMGGIEEFKIDGGKSLGTAFSFGFGAAMRSLPTLDTTLEFRYRSSALDGKNASGSVKSPQLLLGLVYYFGK
ncbi:MAG: hypothetical protein AUJ52_06460 [Elusimicrobia bacterium CG1_02_63_36]|nr:MAG: hypothetical protein AUJ52_06460 [Elusimicrobia bacterium CG1_02_63_36]PIP82978.1 MAG: hypothetical protein COR54_11755 [Elusimicrobia bacterium CG22_combo_CG10-13_8_21_14_all_63_91]PJA17472.1 MAG: hypothetical protein COX66_04285 [Elusimicrobia bacterium CG_4_10_14_0_2_um_filter_63_34]PJB25456.1 MAG: hypothetical protein CO113_08675 [Elusimicrobia bacterium CG_4_9_14_3_um_filter_62_55]